MEKDARSGWNAAYAASRRPLPKPIRFHDLVDPTGATPSMIADSRVTCPGCGYHVCSCRPTGSLFGIDAGIRAGKMQSHKVAQAAAKYFPEATVKFDPRPSNFSRAAYQRNQLVEDAAGRLTNDGMETL